MTWEQVMTGGAGVCCLNGEKNVCHGKTYQNKDSFRLTSMIKIIKLNNSHNFVDICFRVLSDAV